MKSPTTASIPPWTLYNYVVLEDKWSLADHEDMCSFGQAAGYAHPMVFGLNVSLF